MYELLRYGVKVKPEVGENTLTVWLIDWKEPLKNDFAVAEEVTVPAADAKAYGKHPDVVLYVNGIALGVLALKRSTVSVAEDIRQNLDSQKKVFIGKNKGVRSTHYSYFHPLALWDVVPQACRIFRMQSIGKRSIMFG